MWKALIGTAVLATLLTTPVLALDLDDVIRMLEAGLGEEVILKVIDADRTEFALTSDDLIALKDAGASDWMLQEIIDRAAEPVVVSHPSYTVLEPYSTITLGYVYDPFDFYFAAWPYYYAYYSPFSWCWNWWYYGGPVHGYWCDPYGYRACYYDEYWGTRSIWDRGWRGGVSYTVPAYDNGGKDPVRVPGARPANHQDLRSGTQRGDLWTRLSRGEKPARVGSVESGGSGERPTRAAAWGRPERRSESSSGTTRTTRTPRSEVRSTTPSRGTHAPRTGLRTLAPSRQGNVQRSSRQVVRASSTPSRGSSPSSQGRSSYGRGYSSPRSGSYAAPSRSMPRPSAPGNRGGSR